MDNYQNTMDELRDKEGFCKALRMIKEQEVIDEQFSKALAMVGSGHFAFGADNKYLIALRDVLKETAYAVQKVQLDRR